MIPFDLEPLLYIGLIIGIVEVIIFIGFLIYGSDVTRYLSIFGIVTGIIMIFITVFFGVVMCNVYTDTITICAHTEGDRMKVVDTNQNLYYVRDDLTWFKIKDGDTVKVKIENRMGEKYIYYVDAQTPCNNSTCGVSPI